MAGWSIIDDKGHLAVHWVALLIWRCLLIVLSFWDKFHGLYVSLPHTQGTLPQLQQARGHELKALVQFILDGFWHYFLCWTYVSTILRWCFVCWHSGSLFNFGYGIWDGASYVDTISFLSLAILGISILRRWLVCWHPQVYLGYLRLHFCLSSATSFIRSPSDLCES